MLRSQMSSSQQQEFIPRRIALHHVHNENSLAEPRTGTQVEQHAPPSPVGPSPSQCTHGVLFPSHTRFTWYLELFCTKHVTLCTNKAFAGNHWQFSLPFLRLLPPSLCVGATASYVKFGRSYYAKKFTRRACPLYSSIIYF